MNIYVHTPCILIMQRCHRAFFSKLYDLLMKMKTLQLNCCLFPRPYWVKSISKTWFDRSFTVSCFQHIPPTLCDMSEWYSELSVWKGFLNKHYNTLKCEGGEVVIEEPSSVELASNHINPPTFDFFLSLCLTLLTFSIDISVCMQIHIDLK